MLFKMRAGIVGMVVCAALGCLLLMPVSANAVPINYGDFSDFGNGGSILYTGVEEDSITDPTPLYGAPTISVDTLDFNPTGFGAFSIGGGLDFTDGQLNFGMMAMFGTAIDSIRISEGGDYTLAGVGTALTSVDISTPITVTILEVDGVELGGVKPEIQVTLSHTFDLISDPGFGVFWGGGVDIDVQQALIDEGISFSLGATKVDVVLNNALFAFSETSSVAFVAKKDFVSIGTSVVPEPATLSLAALAIFLSAVTACRRKRA